jgi:hypothetical protein
MTATPEQLEQHGKAVKKHVFYVRKNGRKLIKEFQKRLKEHDLSKLEEPELSVYAEHNDKLKLTEYGTKEYEQLLELVKPAITAHYSQNRHHPEHFPDGINEMDLVDLLELLSDWTASVKKNKNGNIHRSIELNTKRFNISPQLAQILTNTVHRYLS